MKDRIEAKIELIVENIIQKKLSDITLDDYTILVSELRDIRCRESQAENTRRMAELFSMVTNIPSSTDFVK